MTFLAYPTFNASQTLEDWFTGRQTLQKKRLTETLVAWVKTLAKEEIYYDEREH